MTPYLCFTPHFSWDSTCLCAAEGGRKTVRRGNIKESARAVTVQNRGFKQPRLKRRAFVPGSTHSDDLKTMDLKIISNF